MPLTHLLDTSVYAEPLKMKPAAAVERRWGEIGDEAIAISAVVEGEVLCGLELRQSPKLKRLYEDILKNRLTVLPVDGAVAKRFAEIKAAARRKGVEAKDADLLIAATAKARGLILATMKYREFAELEGVAVEDWSR